MQYVDETGLVSMFGARPPCRAGAGPAGPAVHGAAPWVAAWHLPRRWHSRLAAARHTAGTPLTTAACLPWTCCWRPSWAAAHGGRHPPGVPHVYTLYDKLVDERFTDLYIWRYVRDATNVDPMHNANIFTSQLTRCATLWCSPWRSRITGGSSSMRGLHRVPLPLQVSYVGARVRGQDMLHVPTARY